MSTSAFGVEHDDVSKGILGASKKTRRAAGAAKAHMLIASKYDAANRGAPGAVTAAAGTRFKSSTQLRRTRLNEARGHNAGNADFHREQAARKLAKSAFGVEHGDVAKAHAYTDRGRRKKAEDESLRSTLSASEARRAALTDGGSTLRQAPRGKKLKALGTYTAHSRSRHGTRAGGHAKAKQKHGF